jgi:ubiquinone/menaquinone biosynthesis C-methylase UbiE
MVDSGPNASPGMMKIFPIVKGPVTIGNDSWIGANSIIMPNVTLGEFCVVASNSFVNKSFPPFSIIGGTPARLIRNFTATEIEKMKSTEQNDNHQDFSEYEINYLDLPFEGLLRKYRIKKLLEILGKYPHKRFLEIGSGPYPLFQVVDGYEKMFVVEPGKQFYNIVLSKAKCLTNVHILNETIENAIESLKNETFDFIVIGGFLHEISNAPEVLDAIRKVCSKDTVIYSFVPNARSMHRLLALKMDLIESLYEKSGHDKLFVRQYVYDSESFNELFSRHKYKTIESGSYFLKPFTHFQMDTLIEQEILSKSTLDGLDKMVEFFPGMGAELWNIVKIDD